MRPPPDTFRLPVTGRRLRPGTLTDQLNAPATLLVFLRHLGCVFCREMVGDVRRAAASAATGAAFPPVLFVTQSPADALDAFFDRHWPGARAVADPGRTLYRAFGIARATFGGAMGPMAWSCGLRALAKGNVQALAPAVGDPWLLPALFLLAPDGTPHWEFRAKHVGDRPDYATMPTERITGWGLAETPAGSVDETSVDETGR